MKWQFDVTPIHQTLAHYLAYHTDISRLHGNYLPFIQEVINSQIYPFNDYPYPTLYETLMEYGVSIEVAESITAYVFQALSIVFEHSDILEMCGENDCQVCVDHHGIATVSITPHKVNKDDILHQQLIERELQAYENGDYIPTRQRLLY